MKKRVIALLLFAAGGAFAEPLEFFDFNDAVGQSFNSFNNSGSLGSVWNYGGVTGVATDGAGHLVVTNAGGQAYRTLPAAGTTGAEPSANLYATPLTTGKYRLEMNISSLVLPDPVSLGTNATGVLEWRVNRANNQSIASIRINADNGWIQLVGREGGSNAYNTYGIGGRTNLTGLVAAIEFDFDNDTIEYFLNGESKKLATDFTETQLSQAQFLTSTPWHDENMVTIDSMGLSSIPEPGTLGLIGIFGGGIFFVRRRLRR